MTTNGTAIMRTRGVASPASRREALRRATKEEITRWTLRLSGLRRNTTAPRAAPRSARRAAPYFNGLA